MKESTSLAHQNPLADEAEDNFSSAHQFCPHCLEKNPPDKKPWIAKFESLAHASKINWDVYERMHFSEKEENEALLILYSEIHNSIHNQTKAKPFMVHLWRLLAAKGVSRVVAAMIYALDHSDGDEVAYTDFIAVVMKVGGRKALPFIRERLAERFRYDDLPVYRECFAALAEMQKCEPDWIEPVEMLIKFLGDYALNHPRATAFAILSLCAIRAESAVDLILKAFEADMVSLDVVGWEDVKQSFSNVELKANPDIFIPTLTSFPGNSIFERVLHVEGVYEPVVNLMMYCVGRLLSPYLESESELIAEILMEGGELKLKDVKFETEGQKRRYFNMALLFINDLMVCRDCRFPLPEVIFTGDPISRGEKMMTLMDDYCTYIYAFITGTGDLKHYFDRHDVETYLDNLTTCADELSVWGETDESSWDSVAGQIERDLERLKKTWHDGYETFRLAMMECRQEETAYRDMIGKNPEIGYNDPCPCGSGKKFKKCCLQ